MKPFKHLGKWNSVLAATLLLCLLISACGPTPTPQSSSTFAGPSLGDTRTRPADGMVMVYVPAGEFEMGSGDDEVDYAMQLCDEYDGDCNRQSFDDEQPVHTITLGGFWIDQTEVTNAQYAKFCEETELCYLDSGSSRTRDSYYGNSAYDDYPVIDVVWVQAAVYCQWAGARLPTEAEWEYAARGPERLIFPWGDEFDGTRMNYCNANESLDDGDGDTTPVGRYPDGASWCGALDMAGNVGEWVADWYDSEYYERSLTRNPTGPYSPVERVQRGGSFGSCPAAVRAATRLGEDKESPADTVGFRCTISESTDPAPTKEPAPSVGDSWTRPADGMVMIYVPAGEFEMGSSEDELNLALQWCNERYSDCEREWFEDEQPMHTVGLDGFWIDQTEVTNAQYAKYVEARNGSSGGGWPPGESGSYTRDSYYGDSAYDDYPVINIMFLQAADYCEWAGARLPTEAEWEHAARGPERRLFPWGDAFDGRRLNYCDATCELDEADDSFDDGHGDTARVGSYPDGTSWCGALDMAGNVAEWVADWYDSEYYGRSPSWNPTGPPWGWGEVDGVLRGGSWADSLDSVRCASRQGDWLTAYYVTVGFRCARGPE